MYDDNLILFIEINNFNYIFSVGKIDEQNNFKISYELKSPIGSIENKLIINLEKVSNKMKENIYLIEKNLKFTFKEVVLILDNFNLKFINLTGFKKLNGSQVMRENITYILNTLKAYVDKVENNKTFIHIFNTKFNLDKKKIENLPIGLFGDFYSHELSFSLINQNDYKNLNSVFEKCNLKIKKILLKSFVKGATVAENNKNIETFFHITIYKKNTKIFYFENNSLKYEQEFSFGSDIVAKDISKITSLKIDTVHEILNCDKFTNNILNEDLIDNSFLKKEANKKVKKKLVHDIALARIKEIFEIMILKNVNLNHYKNSTDILFIEIDNYSTETGLIDLFTLAFADDENFNVYIQDNLSKERILKTANKLVHFGWNKEAIPMAQPKKSIIARFFDAIFE